MLDMMPRCKYYLHEGIDVYCQYHRGSDDIGNTRQYTSGKKLTSVLQRGDTDDILISTDRLSLSLDHILDRFCIFCFVFICEKIYFLSTR